MNKLKAVILLAVTVSLAIAPYPAPGMGRKLKLEDAVTKIADEMRGAVQKARMKRIGISEFNPTAGAAVKLGPYLADRLTAAMVQGGTVEVIERAKLDVILAEQRLGQTALVNEQSARKVGRLLGIQAFLIGSYTVLGKTVQVTARLVDGETGKVLAVCSVKLKKNDDVKALLAPLVPPTPLQLEATLLVQRKTNRGYDAVLVKEGDTLYTNDNIKIFFRTNEDCYVYALLFGASGEAQRIFPHPQVNMSNRVTGGKGYYIPPGDDWFWLDEKTGTETLYIIASYKPLRDIDKLLVEMEKAGAAAKLEASRKMQKSLDVQTRGIGGVRPGGKVTITTSDGRKIEKVTEAVTGKVEVVRRISFKHR